MRSWKRNERKTMNEYFTKEYIELCNDKRIQELRLSKKLSDYYKLQLNSGDWVYSIGYNAELSAFNQNMNHKLYIWLPTGDQLDEEIIKICKKYEANYYITYNGLNDSLIVESLLNQCGIIEFDIVERNDNPLIAKLKLLLQLL